jgi:hypothetical protein
MPRLVVGFLPWIILGMLGNRRFLLALVPGLVAAACVGAHGCPYVTQRGSRVRLPCNSIRTSAFSFRLIGANIAEFAWTADQPSFAPLLLLQRLRCVPKILDLASGQV